MRVIIAGTREFEDYQLLAEHCNRILTDVDEDIVILTGKARGADRCGEQYAMMKGLVHIGYVAEWTKYGNSAGFKRNLKMVENADMLIAFWDGTSKGTKHTINLAKQRNLIVHVVTVRIPEKIHGYIRTGL